MMSCSSFCLTCCIGGLSIMYCTIQRLVYPFFSLVERIMKQRSRITSALDIPYGARYPHLTYGFQSDVLLRPPQYRPTKSDLVFPPLAQVLYKPTPTYHSPRVFLPVLQHCSSPPIQFPVYHELQVCASSSRMLIVYSFSTKLLHGFN